MGGGAAGAVVYACVYPECNYLYPVIPYVSMPFPSLIWLALLLYGDIVLSLGFRQVWVAYTFFFPVLSLYFDPKLVRILISYILPSLSPKYSQSTEYNQRKGHEIDEAKYR